VLNNLIYALANDRIGNDRDEYVDWLKSLKDRVWPKQEWSEEDENILKDIITDVKFEGYNNDMQANSYKKINWLKSLKERYTWKPSDDQILSLTRASNSLVSKEDTVILRKLLNDLEKLTE
jgi:hypothetical protein